MTYNHKSWAYPMSTVLAPVAFLLLLDTSLLSQGGFMHYSQQLTRQHSTKLLFFCLFVCFCFFLSQSSDHPMKGPARPPSPTRLGMRPRDLGLLNKYSLGHCGLCAASRRKLAFQASVTHYSQQLTLQHSTKLLFVFFFLSRSKLIFKVPTTT